MKMMNCWLGACGFSLLLLTGCETSTPTSAVLLNGYPGASTPAVGSTVVYKGWWAVALFADPVLAGEASDPVRVVEGTDYGYALLAPGWDSSSGTLPSKLIPVRSARPLSVARGDTLSFVVSASETTDGDCTAGHALSQTDADFITQRIFPGEFAAVTYDAATCTAVASEAAGAGGGGGEGGDAAATGQAGTR